MIKYAQLMRWCVVIMSLVLGSIPVVAGADWVRREAPIMGTRIAVEVWADQAAVGERAVASVLAEMERINALMSPYIDSSELSRINAAAGSHGVVVSSELFSLIRRAIEFGKMSDGAFDITYASVGHLYQYRDHKKPSPAQREKAVTLVDYRLIKLDFGERRVELPRAGMKIDLGGIAKGHAVDNAIRLLKKAGIAHAIVTAGGDSRVLGDHRGRPWVLGVKHPRGEGSILRLPLSDVAISTSGDYERYFEVDGRRYHHIIDPSSGDSSRRLLSATVIADDSTTADALSTTLFVMGPKAGLALINQLPNISCVLVKPSGKVVYSNDLVAPADKSD